MGKKRIIQKSSEESVKDVASVAAKTAGVVSRKRIIHGKAYIKSSYNNIIINLTDLRGNSLAWSSSGSLGFKGAKKSTPYAASLVAKTAIEKVKKTGLSDIKVIIKGIGSGRESAIRSLANGGLNIVSIQDLTPIPHNGCRPPKPRRV